MNQKKKDREKRVRKKILRMREKRRLETQTVDRFPYEKLKMYKKTPIVNVDESVLAANNKDLKEMLDEIDALEKFRLENKDKHEEMFQQIKENQENIANQIKDFE